MIPVRFSLQVGAFTVHANAVAEKSRFEGLGYDAEMMSKVRDTKSLFIVMIGNYATYDEAKAAAAEVKRKTGCQCHGGVQVKPMENAVHIPADRFQEEYGILGDSVEMRKIIEVIEQVAPTDITVLVTGESGAGKEVIAKAIHGASTRSRKPMVTVNCGAIPEGIIESELFGHERGSFTGASEQRKGYFELADGGTIFLDEVGELPLAAQVKFLRILENGEFQRVGSSTIPPRGCARDRGDEQESGARGAGRAISAPICSTGCGR